MLNRRHFLCIFPLAATLPACDSSGARPGVSATWRGRWIEVHASDGVSLNSGHDQAEIEVGGHRIVIRETEITVNGASKAVRSFRRVVVDVTSSSVTVTVDGTQLFS